MKQETLSFIFGVISSSMEEIAPIVSKGLQKEDWEKFLKINTLITVLNKELVD